MRIKVLLLTVFISAICFFNPNIKAQKDLTIEFKDNSKVSSTISEINKITFTGSVINIKSNSGTSTSYAVSTIKLLSFGTVSGFETTSTADIYIYPNPATDYITVEHLPATDVDVYVYSISGVKVLFKQLNNLSNSLDISSLNRGLYILKIEDLSVKFNKR